MPLSRRGPICHGCQQRSSRSLRSSVRQFQCEYCEAFNHFDEYGEIADPPTQVTNSFVSSVVPTVQYAYQVPGPSSPLRSKAQDSVFCANCIKNQQCYTDALANYLPPRDDPSYDKYEAAYHDWKKSLEERYPQVCAECLPRAQKKLKDTRYGTLTEDMRRKMLRSKHGIPISYHQMLSCRGIFYMISGAGWWSSALTQLTWHALGLLSSPESLYSGDETPTRIWQCAQSVLETQELPWPCFQRYTSSLVPSMIIGFLCCWWHRTLIQKMHTSGGRMKGHKSYLQLQIVTLTIRLGLWRFLRERTFLTPQAFKGAHTAALAFLLIMLFASLNAVHIDYTPRFTFKEIPEPTVTASSQLRPTPNTLHQNKSSAAVQPSPLRVEPFPIGRLGTTPTADVPSSFAWRDSPYESDTETTDAGDYEEMDWTPTRRGSASLRPTRPSGTTNTFGQPHQTTQDTPSPFHGTLPSAPITPAHRARNPPRRPFFKKTPLAKQENFFSDIMASQSTKAQGVVPLNPSQPKTTDFMLNPGKLNLNENPVETGLENIFDNFFTIQDDPPEVQAARSQSARHSSNFPPVLRMVAVWISPLVIGIGLAYAWSVWQGDQVNFKQMPVKLPRGGTNWDDPDEYDYGDE